MKTKPHNIAASVATSIWHVCGFVSVGTDYPRTDYCPLPMYNLISQKNTGYVLMFLV